MFLNLVINSFARVNSTNIAMNDAKNG